MIKVSIGIDQNTLALEGDATSFAEAMTLVDRWFVAASMGQQAAIDRLTARIGQANVGLAQVIKDTDKESK